MADFTSSGWSLYISIVTLVSVAFCVWLALVLARGRTPGAQVGTTGHSWDETLEEYNHPLPRWWLWLFMITCAFALAYLVLYPGLGAWQGVLGWSQKSQYEREVARVDEVVEPLFARYLAQDIPTVAADAQAREIGERMYLTYCVQCHGSNARGSRGFPNLTDRDWLWGGDPETIVTTITGGRQGVMPALGAAVGSADDVQNLANFVLSLSDSGHDAARAALGKPSFTSAGCIACHGADGKGNPALGAPNLTDKTWLHGGGIATLTETIVKGRSNQMPAFGEMLGKGKVHLLAAYVWGLSNLPAGSGALR
ncbi:MAG: cytochrome-c oxidase, cbb3-type subunit III [Burkholderiaceae bacterium]|nr:cytochrome-c oxidase, cbb3-type subunit III [Burkholderiaceae bacterium]MEB2350251.1 cytochrome-c oxidase, cbb3-type subunit III [Burkholderiaceae bacterium]